MTDNISAANDLRLRVQVREREMNQRKLCLLKSTINFIQI